MTLLTAMTNTQAIGSEEVLQPSTAVSESVAANESANPGALQGLDLPQESSIDWLEDIEITPADPTEKPAVNALLAGNVGIVRGYALYIDGVSYGVLAEERAAQDILEEIVREVAAPEADQKVEIVQPVEIKETYVLKSNLMDDLNVKTSLFDKEENGAPVFDIRATRSEKTTSEIPFETVKYDSNDYYRGQEKVTKEGKVGTLETETVYSEINGVAQEPEIVAQNVITPAVNEEIAVGTKELPKGYATGDFIRPTTGYISSYYGPRWGSFHYGIDIANSSGTAIIAADGGTVTKAKYEGSYGNMIIIDHGNGYQTAYAHLSKIGVHVGQKVDKGEWIGKMGSTGHSTGPHLHFEVRVNGVKKNPLNYL